MKIIKKINNNVAIGLTKDNHEIVIFGKGIGFGQMPYELTDLSKIQRTFYNIDSRYYGLLNEIPEKIFLIVTQLLDIAKRKIDGNWNPNVVFILVNLNMSILS
jgi:beta-glucoside operon transcriptional antiterminator